MGFLKKVRGIKEIMKSNGIKINTSKAVIPLAVLSGLLLTGCAHNRLNAPCPHFGAHCHQVPVNHWDNRE